MHSSNIAFYHCATFDTERWFKMEIKDQKRYNREILYHYPIIPYGIRRVT